MGEPVLPAMATDNYYLQLAKKNHQHMVANDMRYTEEIPVRGVRHQRLTQHSKLRHVAILREKAVEEPRRETVNDTNDPLAGPDGEAILSRRQAECVNGKRTV